jgi:hypothetical protein
MMGRKGQIVVFVIIGLVTVLLVSFFLFKLNQSTTDELKHQKLGDSDLSPISGYITMCLEKTSKDAVVKLGEEGRLYSDAYLKSSSEKIAYFYYKGDGYFPATIDVIEDDLSRFIKENLFSCIGDYKFLGYDISDDKEKLRVSSSFSKESLDISLFYPVKVKKGNSEITITDFSSKVKIDFNQIYELSKKIYSKTKQDPDWIDMGFLLEQKDYKIRLIKVSDDTIVYEITDKTGKVDDHEYSYRFAVKYNM